MKAKEGCVDDADLYIAANDAWCEYGFVSNSCQNSAKDGAQLGVWTDLTDIKAAVRDAVAFLLNSSSNASGFPEDTNWDHDVG
jgi:hypothetical protein